MQTIPTNLLGMPLSNPKCPKPVKLFWLEGKTLMSYKAYLRLAESRMAFFRVKSAA